MTCANITIIKILGLKILKFHSMAILNHNTFIKIILSFAILCLISCDDLQLHSKTKINSVCEWLATNSSDSSCGPETWDNLKSRRFCT